jgi:hypothetical protein
VLVLKLYISEKLYALAGIRIPNYRFRSTVTLKSKYVPLWSFVVTGVQKLLLNVAYKLNKFKAILSVMGHVHTSGVLKFRTRIIARNEKNTER